MKRFTTLLLVIICKLTFATTIAFHNPPVGGNANRSIWPVITGGYGLNHFTHNKRVRYYLNYYKHHSAELEAILNNAKPYLFYIVNAIQARKMPMELALLPAVESGYRTRVRSPSGALGMWQLLPATAQAFDVTVDSPYFDGRSDFWQSTIGALGFLRYLDEQFNNDWYNAMAAYNTGEGNLQNAINFNVKHHIATGFFELNLPTETTNYVPKLLAIAHIIKHPSQYGIHLPKLMDYPIVTKVLLREPVSLATVSKLSGVPYDTVLKLNPAYLKRTLPKSGPRYVFLPNNRVAHFEWEANRHLKRPDTKLVTVHRGNTLNGITREYTAVMSHLITMNGLDPVPPLQINQRLLVSY